MPSFPRQRCASPRELALWDECNAAQARVEELQRNLAGLSAAMEQLQRAYHATPQPPPPSRKAVMQQVAARARCYRRGLSDEARRRTVDYAMSIGALGPDFDESELPWIHGGSPRLPPGARIAGPQQLPPLFGPSQAFPKPPAPEPLHVDLIVRCLDELPAPGSQCFELFVIARLARLAGAWPAMQQELMAAWEIAEDVEGLDPGTTHYPNGRLAYNHMGLYYPNGQLARSRDGLTRYPDGSPAYGPRWFYPGGETAWDRERFFLPDPGHDLVVDVRSSELGDRVAWILRRAARVIGAEVLQGCTEKLGKLPEGVKGIALAELCAVATNAHPR